MAISLAGKRRAGQKRTTSKRLAKEYEAQSRRAQKRKGWSNLLGGVGGKVLGTALAGMTGGLAAPLLMAAGTWAGKKAGYEMTRGMGAKTGGLKGDMYGYGEDEAKTLKEGLEAQMAVDPSKERGGFGKDLISAYGSAALSGGLGSAKSFLKGKVLGEKGASTFGEALFGEGDKFKGLAGAKEALFGKAAEEVFSPLHQPSQEEPYMFGSESVEEPYVFGGEQGGQVPTQDQLMTLLALSQSQQQETAYDNTPLEETKQPTISEIFESRGKTLGGNNINSLAQMMGK